MARFLGISDYYQNKSSSWTYLEDFLYETFSHDSRFTATLEESNVSCSIAKVRFSGNYVFTVTYNFLSSPGIPHSNISPVVGIFLDLSELGYYEDDFEYMSIGKPHYSIKESSKYLYVGPPDEAQIFLLKYSLELYQQNIYAAL